MPGKINVTELRQTGYSYINAANFMVRVAREQEINREAVERYNRQLKEKSRKANEVADLEAELARLMALLEAKRAK